MTTWTAHGGDVVSESQWSRAIAESVADGDMAIACGLEVARTLALLLGPYAVASRWCSECWRDKYETADIAFLRQEVDERQATLDAIRGHLDAEACVTIEDLREAIRAELEP